MTAGSIVLAYNLPAVSGLKLRKVYSEIFLGKITKWNDSAIAAANSSVKLPAIVLSQDFLPPALETVLKNLIELMAAIPSVSCGRWPTG